MTAAASCDWFDGAYSGRRVLVTGHTGFKGSWLIYWLLALGAQVTGYALDPPTDPSLFVALGLGTRIDHHIGDVRDASLLRQIVSASRPEIVLHLAAQPLVRLSYEQPVETFATNIMGTVNLLEAVRTTASVRAVVIVTSDKCYENREWEFAYRENDPLGGHDPYSASKGCAELVTAAYRRSFFGAGSAAAIATARAGNVIGGGDWALDRIVPDCVRALSAGEPISVRNPDAVRPWQHVLDPTAGYLLLAARLCTEGNKLEGAWNFGPASGGNLRVRDVVDKLIDEWGEGSWVSPAPDAGNRHEANFLKLDCSKAADLLGWRSRWNAEHALGVTARWYRSFCRGGNAETLTSECLAGYLAETDCAGAISSSERRTE